jgi:Anti-sigma-K factor rskA
MTLPKYSEEFQELAAGYVLDDLSPEEIERIEHLMIENPELHQELKIFQETMGMLSFDAPVIQPPAHLRQKTLDMAAIRLTLRGTQVESPSDRQVKAQNKVSNRSMPQISKPWGKVVAAIATISAITAILLGIDNFRLRQELAVTQSSDTDRVASLLQKPDSRLVAIAGQENNTKASGTLLFRKGKWQQVVLTLSDLPPLPSGEVYRLWLSLDSNQTIFCGEFNTNPSGSVLVSINPPQLPPQGTKTTGIFVTKSAVTAPLEPTGKKVATGTI